MNNKCCRCENKSYKFCSDCIDSDCIDYKHFKPTCTYEEWKQKRKEDSRRDNGKHRKTR